MSKQKVVEEFNNTLDEFIQKLILQFPQESKLKSYYSVFKMSKMYDNSVPIKIYMGGCIKFKDQIKIRDSNFFVNRKEFVKGIAKCSSFSDDIGLVNYWHSLSEETKKAIWDYVQTLFVFGEMYINNDTTIINKINNIYNNLDKEEFDKMSNTNELSSEFKKKF
tara:strand:+ start:402 stop:893 length:492 start_codon:yes stop_codon:yes gene_type:complete